MIDGIEPLYRKIAQAIQAGIEEPWETAVVEATFYSEHVNFANLYYVSGREEPKAFSLTGQGRLAFLDLHDLFEKSGKPVWCRGRFELRPDGKFKMDWGYDGCDKKGRATYSEEEDLKSRKWLSS